MNNPKPITTKYGILNGRDCIYLDNVSFSNRTNQLILKGELDGALCSSAAENQCIPYELTFNEVLVSKITELDTWKAQKHWYNETSFDEILDSNWLMELSGKKTSDHKHFIVLT